MRKYEQGCGSVAYYKLVVAKSVRREIDRIGSVNLRRKVDAQIMQLELVRNPYPRDAGR